MTAPFALVLAAGGSRRFGSPKALARFKGRTFLELAVERVRAVVADQFAVVLGTEADSLSETLGLSPNQVIRQSDFTSGQSSSLRAGLAKTPVDARGVLVTLVDQPLVTAEDLHGLIARWGTDTTSAAAAEFVDEQGSLLIGAPCILPRAWFGAIEGIEGDRGAGALLRASPNVLRIPMASAAFDVDTPADLDRIAILG
jgi:molybdenum cofactor cytidylyltransferase